MEEPRKRRLIEELVQDPKRPQNDELYTFLGDNKMIEAPQSGSVVKVSPLRTAGAIPNVVRLL